MKELSKFISKVRLKIRFVFFLNWLLELYLYLSVLYIVGYFFDLNISYYYLFMPIFFAILLSIVRPIDSRDVAIIIDKDLNLNERVITSLEFSSLNSPIVESLILETLNMLKSLDLKKVYPLRFRKRLKYLILVPFLVLLSLFLYQNVFYPRVVSSPVEESGVSRISIDLVNLQQKLVSEKPELAKRLEVLRKEIEEKKITPQEGINILKEITKEIDKTPSSGIDSKARADIKRMLELVMNKMNDNKETSGSGNNESLRREESQEQSQDGSREGMSQKNPGAQESKSSDNGDSDTNYEYSEQEGNNTRPISGEQREEASIDKNEQSSSTSMRGSSEGSAGDLGKKEEGGESSASSDTVEEGGTLPGKGERENKLGEESNRNETLATPQYVPGIAKEEGNIRLRIKSLGKEVSPTVEEKATGGAVRSVEDPIKKESVPYEYKEVIRLYFERLKGE